MQKAIADFEDKIDVVNDNGSENYRHEYGHLQSHNIVQYFARPHTSKDKPHVENLIGKLQQECLDEHRARHTSAEREE